MPLLVELRLYHGPQDETPFQVIALAPEQHKTFLFWHVYVVGVRAGVHYTWRVAPPALPLENAPELLDPWARAVSDVRWDRKAAQEGRASAGLRAIVVEPAARATPSRANWDLKDAVIYELHVGGFTRHRSAGVQHPGTFAGLVEKIPYLKRLGITHVELLPVMAFDAQDVPAAAYERGLRNYWGYSTYGFYAPHPAYCVDPAQGPREFQDCVRAFHEAGIGVILDVVFNHTAEGGAGGPVINFKAIADAVFYHRDGGDPRGYRTTRAAATPSTATTRWSRATSCAAWSTGPATWEWTASASTSPACSRAARTARCSRTRPCRGPSSCRRCWSSVR
jgi:glycogen operon protein